MVSLRYLTVQTIFFALVHSFPTRRDSEHVSFIKKSPSKRSLDYVLSPFDIEYKHLDIPTSIPLSYQENVQFWDTVEDSYPNFDVSVSQPLHVEIKNGHVTPDFSNGLEYPDPLLLVGPQAKKAATFLYSRELFFGNIPHTRALLNNQNLRERNGLPLHKLGSLNLQSSFWRKN
ncbi:hypothetical protein WA026_016202 [Henosepilachna vigintioctopunctata]|uniref:Uncharacterized protein n=1 Tax=Henosepilachna vigintioctopunctata TaxID=420089 RepID=A0AAW1TUP3_9CUCU